MRQNLRWAICLALGTAAVAATGAGPATAGQAIEAESTGSWYRGNVHAHTDRSDGNAPPETVLGWYQRLGYHFLTLSDHNLLTPVTELNERFGEEFLVIAGEEVSAEHEGRAVHLNGVALAQWVEPQKGNSVAEVINANARAIRRAGGVPILNHPNYGWFISAEAVLAADEVHHFELYNPHPVNNTEGGGGCPSTEELWDQVLSEGRLLYAVAADDAHDYESFVPTTSKRGPSPSANPGSAWIMVWAQELTAAAIAEAIDRGDFYATSGVEFLSYTADRDGIRLSLSNQYRYRVDVPGELRYRTFFIGKDGKVLSRDESLTPEYRFQGTESYVRARVEASDGTRAWTQPVFVQEIQKEER